MMCLHPFGSDLNEWIIPKFPIIRSNACRIYMLKNRPEHHYDNSQPTREFHYDILAETSISLSSSQELPTAIHLGLSSDSRTRCIQFTTGIAGGSVVEIAKRSSNHVDSNEELDFVKVTGGSTTYTAEEMCQSPANVVEAGAFVDPGHLHTVKVTGLEMDSTYIYRVGLAMGQGVRWSEYYEFRTDHKGENLEAMTTFLVLGDQGCQQSLDSSTAPATAPSRIMMDETELHVRQGKAAAQYVADLIHSIIDNQTVSSVHHLGDLS
jgi:hypothetical protein